jgi:pyruvate,water dikinase
MIQQLQPLGVSVPGGFAVTAHVYDAVLNQGNVRQQLQEILKDLDTTNLTQLSTVGAQARHLIHDAGLPDDVKAAIEKAYRDMGGGSVAVRSSATAEDLPTASFAGQQASFLNVNGPSRVANAVLDCLASVFTDRAITYRVENDFDHMKIKGAVVVQQMVRSDLASSGVAFTLDPDTGFRDVVVLTGSWGLGESVVGGKVDPDEMQVFKPTLGIANDPIIRRRLGRKQTKIVYWQGHSHASTKTVPTNENDRNKFCLSDDEALQLAKWCVQIEKHYSEVHGNPTPMDIEWAKDGVTGKLYIVQARPETVRSRLSATALSRTSVKSTGETVIEGTAIGSDASVGPARVIRNVHDIASMRPGEILVADITDPGKCHAVLFDLSFCASEMEHLFMICQYFAYFRLGPCHSHGFGRCYQPRWTHLSRRHCVTRTRRAMYRRDQRCHRENANWTSIHH